jgi:antitoxin CcdA
MHAIYDQSAPKKATNLSINSDLLKKAKDLNINLSAALEQTLVEQLSAKQKEQWLSENRKSINAYNTYVDEQGSFGDHLRSF